MERIKVICINKDGGNHSNPHEAISNFGWVDPLGRKGIWTLAQMISWLERGNAAYVQDRAGNIAWCGVRLSAYQNKYVQTHADNSWNNNLLSLTECLV